MTAPHLIVIGGGLIAHAVAWRAAGVGFSVSLIRDDQPRTSEAAAGMLAPSFEAVHGRAHPSAAGLLATALSHWDGFASSLVAQTGAFVDYQRTGIVALDATPSGKRVAIPAGFSGEQASLIEAEGQVDPRRLLAALKDACDQSGVLAFSGSVEGLSSSSGGSMSARLRHGEDLEADAVVLAAGGRSSRLALEVPALSLVRGRAFKIRLGAAERHLQPNKVVRTDDLYFCPKADGTIYLGATEELAESQDPGPLDALWARALGVFPALAGAEILGTYDGLRPASATGMPVVGPSDHDDRLFYGFGHDRNGVLLTPWTADRILDHLTTAFGMAKTA